MYYVEDMLVWVCSPGVRALQEPRPEVLAGHLPQGVLIPSPHLDASSSHLNPKIVIPPAKVYSIFYNMEPSMLERSKRISQAPFFNQLHRVKRHEN